MTLKELNVRRLGGNDIIRVGDYYYITGSLPTINDSFRFLDAESDTAFVGRQVQSELLAFSGLSFYRTIAPKTNVTPPQ